MSMCHVVCVSLRNEIPWCESVHGGVTGGRGNPDPGATFAFDGWRLVQIPAPRFSGWAEQGRGLRVCQFIEILPNLAVFHPGPGPLAGQASKPGCLRNVSQEDKCCPFSAEFGVGYFVVMVIFMFCVLRGVGPRCAAGRFVDRQALIFDKFLADFNCVFKLFVARLHAEAVDDKFEVENLTSRGPAYPLHVLF